jgi:hypothetical protein
MLRAAVAMVAAVLTSSVHASAQVRKAATPVAPTPTSFMWQGLQQEFLDAAGAACKATVSLAVSERATCYVDTAGQLRCDGRIYLTPYSFDVAAGPQGVDQILMAPIFDGNAGDAICVHSVDGTMSCMGSDFWNRFGQLGTGDTSAAPQFVTWGGRTDIARIGTATFDQACAMTVDGDVYCAGDGFAPAPSLVGQGSRFAMTIFGTVEIDDPTTDRVSTTAGCVVKNGALDCAGESFGADVVDGGLRRPPTPAFTDTCALDSHGRVSCRRADRIEGTAVDYQLFGGNVLGVALNRHTTRICAAKTDGSLWCADGMAGSEQRVQPAGSIRTTCDEGDSTPPVVRPIVSGTQGLNGWFVSDVQVSWSVADRESPVSSVAGCVGTYVSQDTSGVTFTCTATSRGGTTTQTVVVKRDTQPPFAEATASPAADLSGWRRVPVVVGFTGTDNLGPLTCDPAVRLTRDGLQQGATGLCRDAAGHEARAQTPFIHIDRTLPVITITSPLATTYARNSLVPVSFACGDDLSGIMDCSGSVPNGGSLDTSVAPFNGRLVVTATDAAGNVSRRTVAYRIR